MSGVEDRAAPSRRFTLADGMILVAATAVGIALVRVHQASIPKYMNNFVFERVYGSAWVPCIWTASMVLVGLRGPRPACRRLARRPGWMACLAATVGALAFSIQYLAIYGVSLITGKMSLPFSDLGGVIWATSRALWMGPGLVVAAVWMTLALGGRWRSYRGWAERFSFSLGVFWILLLMSYPVIQVLGSP